MSNKGTRKGRLYEEKKTMATTVINFNVHGKLSSPASQVELHNEGYESYESSNHKLPGIKMA